MEVGIVVVIRNTVDLVRVRVRVGSVVSGRPRMRSLSEKKERTWVRISKRKEKQRFVKKKSRDK